MNTALAIYLMTITVMTSTGQVMSDESECGTCNPSSCTPPGNCLAGRVIDSCDCCYACGRKEGERCDHEDVATSQELGRCGDNLQCRVRTDLDPGDLPEAVCFCVQNYPLCGSNGKTYDNICQLTEARYMQRNGLRAASTGPCRKLPRITIAPVDVRNSTGSNVALMCEVIGWPTPEVEWSVEMQNGYRSTLPGSHPNIAVRSTSGPRHGETTSWLLFSSLQEDDEGVYWCKAQNEVGSATARAHVSVINK